MLKKALRVSPIILLTACGISDANNNSKADSGSMALIEYRLKPKSDVSQISPVSVCGPKVSEKDCAIVSPPYTPMDILSNIKNAIALNLFFKNDIYTNDEMLWKIFAVRQFYKEYPFKSEQSSNRYLSVVAGNFPVSIVPASQGGEYNGQLRIRIIKSDFLLNNGKEAHRVDFYLEGASVLGLSFADVEAVFGRGWQYYQPPVFPTSDNPHPTSTASDTDIVYTIKGKRNMTAEVVVFFDEKKQIERLSISIVE